MKSFILKTKKWLHIDSQYPNLWLDLYTFCVKMIFTAAILIASYSAFVVLCACTVRVAKGYPFRSCFIIAWHNVGLW